MTIKENYKEPFKSIEEMKNNAYINDSLKNDDMGLVCFIIIAIIFFATLFLFNFFITY